MLVVYILLTLLNITGTQNSCETLDVLSQLGKWVGDSRRDLVTLARTP